MNKCHCGKDLSDLNEENIKRHKEKCGKKPGSLIHDFFKKKPCLEESLALNDTEDSDIIDNIPDEGAISTDTVTAAHLQIEAEQGCLFH